MRRLGGFVSKFLSPDQVCAASPPEVWYLVLIYIYIYIYGSVRLDWPPTCRPRKKSKVGACPDPPWTDLKINDFFGPEWNQQVLRSLGFLLLTGRWSRSAKARRTLTAPKSNMFFTFWDQTWDIRYFGTNMGPSKTLFFCVPPPGRRIICCKNAYITRIPCCVPPRKKKPFIYL